MPDIDPPDASQQARFQAFSWLHHNRDTPTERLVEASKDIGDGVAALLQLIEASDLETQEEQALLSQRRRGNLMRLAITSAQLLGDLAQRDIDRRNMASA